MKLSRVNLIILALVVLGVAFGVLYMMYSRQLSEQEQLKAKVSTVLAQGTSQSRLTRDEGD